MCEFLCWYIEFSILSVEFIAWREEIKEKQSLRKINDKKHWIVHCGMWTFFCASISLAVFVSWNLIANVNAYDFECFSMSWSLELGCRAICMSDHIGQSHHPCHLMLFLLLWFNKKKSSSNKTKMETFKHLQNYFSRSEIVRLFSNEREKMNKRNNKTIKQLNLIQQQQEQ